MRAGSVAVLALLLGATSVAAEPARAATGPLLGDLVVEPSVYSPFAVNPDARTARILFTLAEDAEVRVTITHGSEWRRIIGPVPMDAGHRQLNWTGLYDDAWTFAKAGSHTIVVEASAGGARVRSETTFSVDPVAPVLRDFQAVPDMNNASRLAIDLSASEPLAEPVVAYVTQSGATPVAVVLTEDSPLHYAGTTPYLGHHDGDANVRLLGLDAAGNGAFVNVSVPVDTSALFGPVARLVPEARNLAQVAGATAPTRFRAQAYDAEGRAVPLDEASDVAWSIEPASAGSFRGSLLIPAGHAAESIVRAYLRTDPSIGGSVGFVVAEPAQAAPSPAPATVAPTATGGAAVPPVATASPAPSLSFLRAPAHATAGTPVRFAAHLAHAAGNVRYAVAEGEGTIDAVSGVFVAEKAGRALVRATGGGLAADAAVFVAPASAARLDIFAAPAELVAAGGSAVYLATAADRFGNRIDVDSANDVRWTIEPAEAGRFVRNVLTPGAETNAARITARLAADPAVADVVSLRLVAAQPARLELWPKTTVMSADDARPIDFDALVTDAGGNVVTAEASSVVWAASHADAGRFEGGRFVPSGKAGEFKVFATVAGVPGQAEAEVAVLPGVLARLDVAPAALSARASGVLHLQVRALDAQGNELVVPPLAWSVRNPQLATYDAAIGRLEVHGAGVTDLVATDPRSGMQATVRLEVGERGIQLHSVVPVPDEPVQTRAVAGPSARVAPGFTPLVLAAGMAVAAIAAGRRR